MVYDVPRNFIGDTYWREDEPVQDGDEFELEKGILIQVGESTGKMDQDLTGIFEKRGKAQAESPAKVVLPHTGLASTAISKAASSAAVASSQLRPRTLNSLLGTPKGALGRATLPTKSPCEQRRERENHHFEDRVAKRRRLECSYEQKNVGSLGILTRETTLAKHQVNEVGTYLRQEVAKERVTTTSPKKAISKVTKPESRTTVSLDPDGEQRERSKFGTAEARDSVRQQQRMAHLEGTATPNTSASGIEEEHERSAQVRLRIASQKPRRKLMYRDLLSQGPSEYAAVKRKGAATKAVCEKELEHPLGDFYQAEQNRLRARLRRQGETEASRTRYTPEEDEIQTPKSPTLFLTQEDESDPASPHTSTRIPPEPSNPQSHRYPNHQPSKPPPSLKRNKPPSPRPPDPPTTTDAALKLAEMDQLLLRRPEANAISNPNHRSYTPLPSPPKPLPTTSLLNPPKPTTSKPHPPSPPLLPTSPPPPPSLKRSLSNPPPPNKKRSPLRKTVSNPLDLQNPCRESNADLPSPQLKEASPDPWSREAWDLFGCGREAWDGGGGGS